MAEDVTLWTNTVVAKPDPDGWPADGIIASSSPINNNNDLNSSKVTLQYEDISPDGGQVQVGFVLRGVVEEEIAPGVWVPIARQDDEIKGLDERKTQVIVVEPQINFNPGSPEVLSNNVVISRHNATMPDKFRISILMEVKDAAKPQLDSLTLSGYVRKFNFQG